MACFLYCPLEMGDILQRTSSSVNIMWCFPHLLHMSFHYQQVCNLLHTNRYVHRLSCCKPVHILLCSHDHTRGLRWNFDRIDWFLQFHVILDEKMLGSKKNWKITFCTKTLDHRGSTSCRVNHTRTIYGTSAFPWGTMI